MNLVKKLIPGLTVALIATATLVGCGSRSMFPVETSLQGGTPMVVDAKADGDYVLYRDTEGSPIARTHLKVGEPIGFKIDARDMDGKYVASRGTVSAVAGGLSVPIESGRAYEWRRIPHTDTPTKQDNPYWPRP